MNKELPTLLSEIRHPHMWERSAGGSLTFRPEGLAYYRQLFTRYGLPFDSQPQAPWFEQALELVARRRLRETLIALNRELSEDVPAWRYRMLTDAMGKGLTRLRAVLGFHEDAKLLGSNVLGLPLARRAGRKDPTSYQALPCPAPPPPAPPRPAA